MKMESGLYDYGVLVAIEAIQNIGCQPIKVLRETDIECPEATDDRSEVGFWEGNTIVSANKSKSEAQCMMNARYSRLA